MQNKETIDFLLMVQPPLLNRNIMHRRYVIDYHGTLNLETINNVRKYSHSNVTRWFIRKWILKPAKLIPLGSDWSQTFRKKGFQDHIL